AQTADALLDERHVGAPAQAGGDRVNEPELIVHPSSLPPCSFGFITAIDTLGEAGPPVKPRGVAPPRRQNATGGVGQNHPPSARLDRVAVPPIAAPLPAVP